VIRDPKYEGQGYAEFGTPIIRVAGPTVVTTDRRGTTTAEMRVQRVLTASSTEEGIAQLSRDFFDSAARLKACQLCVDCAEGTFSATERTFRSPSIDGPNSKASIVFDCRLSQFAATDGPAAYWRLPIWGFRGNLCPVQWARKIVHPLRLSDESPITPFELFGEMGLVECMPGYEELLKRQENGDPNPVITASMVGPVAGHAIRWEDLDSWFPFDFLNLLAFASGSAVGSPWIEFLDSDARLVRRVHIQLGKREYQVGHSFLHDVIHRGGLGRLLTCAGKSPELRKTYLRVAANHLLHGVTHSGALEDRISQLSRALEALAGKNGLKTQHLLEGASDSVRLRVKNALQSASTQIAEIAREQDQIGDTGLASSLRRIAARTVSHPANTDSDFGLMVLSLLKRFDLHDATVVDAYHQKNPRPDGRKWHEVLSYYRGVSQHGDAFRIRQKEHSPSEIYRLSTHLADIAARIVLKELAYDGQYRPATATWQESRELDWVKPYTAAVELGYGRDED
jgi:hypothetical protein